MNINYHPMDFSTLKKGDVITPEEIEKITGYKRSSDDFWKAQLNLKTRIEKELRIRGNIVTVKSENDSLRILHDNEADQYNDSAFNKGFKRMMRSHVRRLGVNVGNLTDEEKREHERGVNVQAHMLQAAKTARRQLTLESHKRSTPGIENK